jgi:acyl carrier protein
MSVQLEQERQIKEVFATLLKMSPAEVHDATNPASVPRWDSMQHLILVSGLEEEFGVDVDPEEAVEMYEDFAAVKRVVLGKLS